MRRLRRGRRVLRVRTDHKRGASRRSRIQEARRSKSQAQTRNSRQAPQRQARDHDDQGSSRKIVTLEAIDTGDDRATGAADSRRQERSVRDFQGHVVGNRASDQVAVGSQQAQGAGHEEGPEEERRLWRSEEAPIEDVRKGPSVDTLGRRTGRRKKGDVGGHRGPRRTLLRRQKHLLQPNIRPVTLASQGGRPADDGPLPLRTTQG